MYHVKKIGPSPARTTIRDTLSSEALMPDYSHPLTWFAGTAHDAALGVRHLRLFLRFLLKVLRRPR